jgi:monovalent cation:H+ antiporter-2, CPA2 family
MEELALVRDLAVVWLAALVVGALCVRLRLPVIAGYILAGLFIGPFGARLIAETAQIKVLAELGVALLLFALGVELSIRKVFASAGRVITAAFCQIALTVAAAWLVADLFGLVPNVVSGLIFGFICALSSTAVVTKLLVDRAETETLHGRVIVPVLLVQDLALVPVVALLPVVEQTTSGSFWLLAYAFAKAALLIVGVVIGAIAVVPRLLAGVSRTNSRELFLLTVISLCLVVALISKQLGVSLALGAFLSGVMISERPYGHQVLADILPLRDLFATLFFVSVGMLLNPTFIAAHWTQVAIFVLLLIVGKTALAAVSAYIATRSAWSAVLVGVGLAQIGEFSFVLATLGHTSGLLPDSLYNLFFAGAVVTLAISPTLIATAPMVLAKIPQFRLVRRAHHAEVESKIGIRDHIILCGFGRMGRSVGLALQSNRVPFVVIELNGQVVEELENHGIRYIYGDAFNHLVLAKANLKHAACLVVTVPDPVVALHVVTFAREQNPEIGIIVRTNRSEDIDLFRAAGANAVVQPEFEASIEATKMAMIRMRRPRNEILAALRDIRHQGYLMFRPQLSNEAFVDFPHEDYFGVWFIYAGLGGSTLADLHVRRTTGATILAIRRAHKVVPHPDGALALESGDELYVAGDEQQLEKFEKRFPVSRFCPTVEETQDEAEQSKPNGSIA